MSIKKRGEVWYLDIYHGGQRIRDSTGTTDRAEAQRIHDEVKASLWNRKHGRHSLSDALALWLKAAPRSQNEKNAIGLFTELYEPRLLRDIQGTDIYQALLCKSPSHANRIANIIRAALNMAHEAGWCDPIKIQKRKTVPGRIRWLTREEWDALHAELPKHLQPMAQFAVATGLRWSNVANLKWTQVRGTMVSIEAADMKGRRAHWVPLSSMAMEALEAVKGQHKLYCFTYAGKKIGSAKTAFSRALDKAGIEDFTWHDLRHTWASWHVQNGTPLPVLKELGGWASMDLVLKYAHLAPQHIAEWAENSHKASHKQATAPVAQWIEQPPPKASRKLRMA